MAASYATALLGFIDRSGRIVATQPVDAYLDDVATNPVRFDGGSGAGATSPTEYTIPGPCFLIDFVLAGVTGQSKTQINRNNQSVGAILRNSVQLASVVVRPALRIPYGRGSKMTMTQLA
jgi:hypothetical protein